MGKTIYEKIKAKKDKGALLLSDNPYDTSGPNAFDAVSRGAAAAGSKKETYVMSPGPGANNNDDDNNQINGEENNNEEDISSALTYKAGPLKQKCPPGQTMKSIDGVAHCVDIKETPGTPATPGEPNENVEIYRRACGGKNDGSVGTDPVTGQTRTCTQSGEPDPPSNQGSPGKGGKKTVTADPLTVDTPESQQYNMGYAQATNANWARGSMRRGTQRETRKALKDIENNVRANNPDQFQAYKDARKKNMDLDGDGKISLKERLKNTFTGNRQEKKIKAMKDAGMVSKDYESLRTRAARETVNPDSEEQAQKVESMTMNKYNIPINKYGDYKPASSKPMSGEGLETMDRSEVGTFDTPVPTASEVGKAAGSDTDIVGSSGLGGAVVVGRADLSNIGANEIDAFTKKEKGAIAMLGAKQKPYKAKGALTYRAKFGRGAGYKS